MRGGRGWLTVSKKTLNISIALVIWLTHFGKATNSLFAVLRNTYSLQFTILNIKAKADFVSISSFHMFSITNPDWVSILHAFCRQRYWLDWLCCALYLPLLSFCHFSHSLLSFSFSIMNRTFLLLLLLFLLFIFDWTHIQCYQTLRM